MSKSKGIERALRAGGIGAAATGLAAGLSGLGARWQLLRRPLPKTKGSIRVTGLSGPVEIRRDRWGVPHVDAVDNHDLWYAQGFCHGQDRLWQIESYRRAAFGRLAELGGRSALPIDRFARTIGFGRTALAEAVELGHGLRAELDAYCAGVNAAVESASALPVEFQLLRLDFAPWQPADMLATMKLLAFGLSTNWEHELLRAEMVRTLGEELTCRLDPLYPQGNPVVTSPGAGWSGEGLVLAEQIGRVREALGFAPGASGSNNWAVSGALTASGRPLMAGDPHLPPAMPGITYQVSLSARGRTVRGASFPGCPGVAMGQNDDVAWSFTNVMADVMDLFVERIEGDEYEFAGERRPLEIVEETISVKGSEPEHLTVRKTHHGPIVNEIVGADIGEPLALAFSALQFPAVTDAQLSILDVGSGAELVEALANVHTPVSNLVWADRHGSIGYKCVGRLPIRDGGVADVPRPGWTGEHEWSGWIPHDELPEIVDPERGFLVTANNQIADDDYPHHLTSHYLDGYRARRIEELLAARDDHDAASFAAIQTDELSIPGLEAVSRLARIEHLATEQRDIVAIERLRSWDGRMSRDSVAATIYQAFTLRLGRETARAAIGDRDLAARWLDRSVNAFSAHVTSPWRWQSHVMSLWDEADDELIGRRWDGHVLDCLRGALDDLSERYGSDPEGWRWGDVHELEFPHSLGRANPVLARFFNRRLKVGGAQETVNQIAFDPGDPYRAVWAPCWRMTADPTEPDAMRWQAFTGQSGQPGSRHYDDVQPGWAEGASLAAAGEGPFSTLRLVPATAPSD